MRFFVWVGKEVSNLPERQQKAEGFLKSPPVEMLAGQLSEDSALPISDPSAPHSQIVQPENQPPKRAPWWMYVIAFAILVCAAVRYYHYLILPEDPGVEFQPITDKNNAPIGSMVKTVLPGSAGAKAGLEPGDLIVSSKSDGFLPEPHQPYSGPAYWDAGRTYRIEIKRKEENQILYLTLEKRKLRDWVAIPALRPELAGLLVALLELFLAGLIAFRRPYDPAARWGALLFAEIATYLIYMNDLSGWRSTILSIPRVVGLLIVLLYSFCMGSLSLVWIAFATNFPRRLFKQPWIQAMLWLLAVMFVSSYILSDYSPVYSISIRWPNWYHRLLGILGFCCFCAIVPILIWNYLHLHNPNERRRIRVIVVGFTVILIGCIPYSAFMFLLPNWDALRRLVTGPYYLLALSCLLFAQPISMTYAILRHRLFDIRVMVRQGLQYAAARGVMLSLVPIVGVILAADLLLHGNQPLVKILSRRGWIYAVLAGGGYLLHMRRQRWLVALDRRFFRERYDAQRVLRAVIEEIREARSLEKVAPRVISQVESALHPEFAAILLRQPGETVYRVLAGSENPPPPIPADSKLMGLVRLLGKPVEISQSQTGWLGNQLPKQESEFLRQARLEWLFPICITEGRTEALLAIGPKRSEEPYSREDQDLIQGITGSLALLLEQSGVSVREGFEECPRCGACYDSGAGICRVEDATLTRIPFSRLLAGRYLFEQRLGEGGMGVVYQALDKELDRHVAVKLVRPELTASTAAAARFKQEAKAAASFTHPNVVTVHDYGVAGDQRAYLVMELLRGLSLRQELDRNGRLPAPRVSEILRGVCIAADAAHRRRLLHRDLKPENIFLTDAEGIETAKILDFGVVKPLAAAVTTTLSMGQTGPGILVGTLMYMSPEQLRGEEATEGWDIWSLSVLAYEMLAGKHPFEGLTAFDVRDAVLAGRVTMLRKHLPEAPASWQEFFDKALSPRVELRPNTALRLFQDFQQSIQ